MYVAVGPFGDCDDGPTKQLILGRRQEKHFAMCFEKRPGEELYDLKKDPWQIRNVAGEAGYGDAKRKMRGLLDRWMRETGDPRATSGDDRWDRYPYFGAPARG